MAIFVYKYLHLLTTYVNANVGCNFTILTLKFMREKKEYFIVDAYTADIDSEYSTWTDEKQQTKYLKSIASQIGWIIIKFNKLEWQLNELLKKYLCNNTEELSAIYYNLISSDNFASKVDLLKTFYKVSGNGNKKHIFDTTEELMEWDSQVNAIIDKLKSASQIRNKYAHCFWHRLDEDKFVEFKNVINPNNGLNKIFIRFGAQDLKDDFNLIGNLEIHLFNIDVAFGEAYSSS